MDYKNKIWIKYANKYNALGLLDSASRLTPAPLSRLAPVAIFNFKALFPVNDQSHKKHNYRYWLTKEAQLAPSICLYDLD